MSEEWTVRKALEFAVKTEELGALFYKKMAKKFDDNTELKEAFELLAKDEEIHERQFKKLLEKTGTDAADSSADVRFSMLRAMSMSQFFMGDRGLYGRTEEIKDPASALVRAFEMEKATLQFYKALEEAYGESDTLKAVIEAEKGHLFKVMRYLTTDAESRGLSDSF